MVSLLSAKNQYEANLGVAHTANEMQKATLNLLA
jgi:flagellar basal body rod protein FlgC